MDGDIAPEIRIEDVEFFLSQAAVLADLRERLVKADATLTKMAATADAFGSKSVHPGPTRLRGKIEGVRLALSYLDEVTQ